MKKLYAAQVARPLSTANTRPTRLGFATIAWCRYEDLVAAISGCGAVAVFHADAPGEAALLVGAKRAPARHVVWRNAPHKPGMLVVADAAGKITFWLARDRRVNVWASVASVDLPAVAVAVGWNNSCTALAAVLAHGGLAVWAVPDLPADAPRRRPYPKPRDARGRPYPADLPKMSSGTIRPIPSTQKQKLADMFGGQLRCATVAPGHVDPTSVAVVTVSAAEPRRLKVWQVSISKTATPHFEVKPLSSTDMDAAEDGRCVACAAVPKSGMLFAVGDRGVIARWFLKTSRPAGESGWVLHAKTRIDRWTDDAAAKGIIDPDDHDQNVTVNAITRGLQVSKRRKVYAFEVFADSKTLVTSTSAGLFVWDTDKLNIVAGHPVKSSSGAEGSPYWGLCISPGGGAVMALNGQGRVEAHSLIPSLTIGTPDTVAKSALSVAQRLVSTTSADGLRGGWDIVSSVAVQGPAAANLVAKTLTMNSIRNSQTSPVTPEKLTNLKSLMMQIVNVHDCTAHAAKRLLEVAVDAIRQSAPDQLKLMLNIKDGKQLTSAENVQKLIVKGVASTRVTMHQLAAAPLADWIMVLCAVWLQRCAFAVSKHDAKGQMGAAWSGLASLLAPGQQREHGMAHDSQLIRALRSASVAAVVLLALEDQHGEPEADPRYYRFPRDQSAHVIATVWDVSLAWDSGDATRPAGSTASLQDPSRGPDVEKINNTAAAFGRHTPAAQALSSEKKLRVKAAERALGLHGSAVGAGFITSSTRRHESSSRDDTAQDEPPARTEWCPYDLVTGRPLPPWAPLRRCVASGLLAAEITQQKSDSHTAVNGASPWISKWANESPFGGRWARVPSLDLDRYELLPSVVPSPNERSDVVSITAHRQAKTEEVLGQAGSVANSVPQAMSQLQGQGAVGNQQFAVSAASAEAAALAGAQGSNPMAQVMVNGTPQMAHGVPGMAVNPMMQGVLASRIATGVSRVQASPGMSTASSTTDAGSTMSKAAKKRASSSAKGRVRKRMATEPRTPTASQLSDLAGTIGVSGVPGAASPAPLTPALGRTNSAADALSTDTRSTMTTATNATGGVDQDTSKSGRKSRKRGSRANKQAAAAAAAAHAAAAAASAGGVIPPTGSGSLPPGVPPTMSQSSPPSQTPQTPRSAAQSKKQPPRGNQRNHITAAAHAAAAAAAAAAANSKQSPVARNPAMLQGAMSGDAMVGAGMNKSADAVSQLGFVQPNTVSPVGTALPAGARRATLPPGANVGMMANGNAANLALSGSALQQGNFGVQGTADSAIASMNGQTRADVAGMQQQMQGGNGTNAPMGTVGASLATLALHLGLNPSQLNGLTPEQAQLAYQALSRRVALRTAAGLGPGNVQGSPPGPSNPNMLASNPVNPADITSNAAAAGLAQMTPGSAALHLGGGAPGAGRGLVNAAGAVGTMGLPMGAPRTSAAESQTSARVAGGSVPGTGMPTPGQGPVDREGGAVPAIGLTPGAPVPGQSAPGRAPSADRGQRVWTGNLHVRGHHNDMMVPCVAVQYNLAGKAPIRDTTGWPSQLQCDSSKLKSSTQVLEDMSAPSSQWYVRFAPVDANGQEREEPKLIQLVVVMVERKLAFEIKCNEQVGTPGTLYLWGMQVPPHGHSMLGVFRPDVPAPTPEMAVDQELQLMMQMGAGSK